MKIDLHMHSTHSDGKLKPEELVDWAIERNIPTIAITDHEIISGSDVAVEYAKDKNIEVIPGIEIGADDKELEIFDIHIVGLFVNSKNEELQEVIQFNLNAREVQKKKIIEKLNELGYEITFEELQEEAGGPSYGRPHIARILMRKYPDEFPVMQLVFDKLLANPHTVYIRQEKKTIKEVIDVIHNAGGIAILAHPGFYKNQERIIRKFINFGGDGVEVDYAYRNDINGETAEKIIKNLRQIANENNLIISGGTDFHDKKVHVNIGKYGLTKKEFEELKKYYNNIYNT